VFNFLFSRFVIFTSYFSGDEIEGGGVTWAEYVNRVQYEKLIFFFFFLENFEWRDYLVRIGVGRMIILR
jgi:hypothetical protein